MYSGAELGFSTATYLHLAAALPNSMLAVDNQQLNLTGDIVDEPHRIERGSLRVPNGVGLGMQLSQQKLEQYRAEQIGQPYKQSTL